MDVMFMPVHGTSIPSCHRFLAVWMLVGWCLKLQPPFFPPKQNMEIKAGFRMKHKKNMVSGKDILFKSKWLEGRKLRSNLK